MRTKPIPTVIIKIPKDKAKLIHERVSVFLDMFAEQQRLDTRFFESHRRNEFDIRSLAYSCYSQGLADGAQAIEKQDKIT